MSGCSQVTTSRWTGDPVCCGANCCALMGSFLLGMSPLCRSSETGSVWRIGDSIPVICVSRCSTSTRIWSGTGSWSRLVARKTFFPTEGIRVVAACTREPMTGDSTSGIDCVGSAIGAKPTVKRWASLGDVDVRRGTPLRDCSRSPVRHVSSHAGGALSLETDKGFAKPASLHSRPGGSVWPSTSRTSLVRGSSTTEMGTYKKVPRWVYPRIRVPL